ncbi:hypothetical protein [Phytobacter sp. RSE-02]|uniref:hypothetical protein n=1 Tax=Phytobacter sp. RSE-02 TaxID=3229229 RepID=UPI00339D42DC
MPTAKATTLEQAYAMLNSGKYKQVELDFDVDADAFFALSAEFCNNGAKIARHDNHFVIKPKNFEIPALD